MKALTRLRRCAGSSEPPLVAYAICMKSSDAGQFIPQLHVSTMAFDTTILAALCVR